jgi:hypothetical protein
MKWFSVEAWFYLSGYVNSQNTSVDCCKSSCLSRAVPPPTKKNPWGRCVLYHASAQLTTFSSAWLSTPTSTLAFSENLRISWMTGTCHFVIFNKSEPRIAYLTGLRNKSRVYLQIGLSRKDFGHPAHQTWFRRCVLKDMVFENKSHTVEDLRRNPYQQNRCNPACHDDCNIREYWALCCPVSPRRRKPISSSSVTQLSPPYLPSSYSPSSVFISKLLCDL